MGPFLEGCEDPSSVIRVISHPFEGDADVDARPEGVMPRFLPGARRVSSDWTRALDDSVQSWICDPSLYR